MPKGASVELELENVGSLITLKGTSTCLGHLFNFDGHGVFDPNFGKVDVPAEAIAPHNQALDESLVKGLDENCEVGQGYMFYLSRKPLRVHTWTGIPVSDNVTLHGRVITFTRKGKVFRGRKQEDSDAFNFKRII